MEWDVVKEMGRNTIKGVSKGMKATAIFVGSTYTLPSAFRKYTLDYDYVVAVILPPSFGFGLGEFFLAWPVESRSYDYAYAVPFLVRVGTNIASGIYEWYRYEKNKKYGHSPSGSRTPAPSSGSTSSGKLEEKVEKGEIKIKDIPNPWDIDIPKIEDQKMRRNC